MHISICPFCGANAYVAEDSFIGEHWFEVQCNECGARGPMSLNEEIAVNKWNDRNPERD